MDILEQLTYCLEREFPRPVTVALLGATTQQISYQDAFSVWEQYRYVIAITRDWVRPDFQSTLDDLGCKVITCDSCSEWEDAEGSAAVQGGATACEVCLGNHYTTCDVCEQYVHDHEIATVDGYSYCDSCLDRYCYYCEECEEWSRTEHEHQTSCDCEAPHPKFMFPANGAGAIGNDERLDVALPAGTIDQVGITAIVSLLYDATRDAVGFISYDSIRSAVDAVGDQWQTKRGNYTRRISREYYSNLKVKLPDGVLSEIGNLARLHSSSASEWAVEFTRNLNLPAEDFCHEESCWWQSYYESRCALKNWGGLGLRTFNEYGDAEGRAWVQPLNADLKPTHDTMGAHAYIVYNAYGALNGYQAARIVAHLTSKTYCKITFHNSPQYVNEDKGFLVADEATCTNTEIVRLNFEAHEVRDAYTFATKEIA